MHVKTRREFYQAFIEYVGADFQRERRLSNRRMFSVFLWCFFLPVISSTILLLLVKMKILPMRIRGHLDWLILILPVFYSLYILSSEVLVQLPSVLRRGGFVTTLSSSVRESEWRERVIQELKREISLTSGEWEWVISSFKMDLDAMQQRTRYLTALAGAVFFLLMQGIDSLTEVEDRMSLVRTNFLGWIGSSAHDFSQFIGLALFLVLLYLSGSQTTQALRRYLNCAELIALQHSDSGSRLE